MPRRKASKVYNSQIKAGTKLEEYRLCTPYWKKRIEGKRYDHVILTRGYPKRDDLARRLLLPWKGWTMKIITHPHFGPNPVSVYAINVGNMPATPTTEPNRKPSPTFSHKTPHPHQHI